MNDIPIYLQISTFIENQILDDVLLADEQIPSTNELAKLLQINPATARKGMNVLIDQGILYKKRGIGMFVTTEAKKLIVKKRKEEFSQVDLPKLVNEAKRLMITENELITMIRSEYNA